MIFFTQIFQQPAILIGFLFGIVIAISIHEYFHAWTANHYGDPTAKNQGRLTLNPLAHLDLVGTLFLFIAGFGWGKPVPINPNNFYNPKWDQLWVALSGPASNLVTAFIFAIPFRIALMMGGETLLGFDASAISIILDVIVEINIILAVFNLLPVPPLDGAEIVQVFLPASFHATFNQYGPLALFVLIGLEFSSIGFNFFSTVFPPIINTLLYIIKVYPY